MLLKCCAQYASKPGKLSSGHRTGKGQFSFQSKRRARNAKECSNYCTAALVSHTSKVLLKILQARLQQYMEWELPDVQAGFRKGREIRYQITNILGIIGKARGFQRKRSTSASLSTLNPLTMWITTNCGKFLKRWECLTTLPVSWETCIWVKKHTRHGTTDWFKIGKGVQQALYCYPVYLTYVQSTSGEMTGWINHKLDYINTLRYAWYHSNGKKWRGTKEPLDKGERGQWKKLNFKKIYEFKANRKK